MSVSDIAASLIARPLIAHAVLFSHRHSDPSPSFHKDMIELYHSDYKNVIVLTFRGSSKSTLLEETAVLLSASGQTQSVLIVGDSYNRAVERLRSIKRELESNTYLTFLFGPQLGDAWTESRIELRNGCVIVALGQGQALRGIKHNTSRPDLCLVDDLESDDSVATPEARTKLSDWFWADLMPALSPDRRLIMTATPLDPQSLAVSLAGMSQFESLHVPIESITPEGQRISSWPERFPLTRQDALSDPNTSGRLSIDEIKQSYIDAGKLHKYMSEYMVRAIDPETRLFTPSSFRYDSSLVHTWQPVMLAYDPARSLKPSAATTGFVAASFLNRRLVIWEAKGARLSPSEIIDHIFASHERYNPIVIGIEKDGLDEFLLQPLRHAQLQRGTLLPLEPLKAPRHKLEFIRRLQPLFQSGDIIFAGQPSPQSDAFQETINQFQAYPTGLIDIPNACAYLLQLRQGEPIYSDASERHILDFYTPKVGVNTLAVHAGPHGSAAILFTYFNKVLYVLRDWVYTSPPGECLGSALQEARLVGSRPFLTVTPPLHFDTRNSYGLLAAFKGQAEVRRGGDPLTGRELVRELLRSEHMGSPRLLLGPDAVWTRRALYGGFTWEPGRDRPRDSLSAVVAEALESAVAMLRPAAAAHLVQRMAYTADGRAYQTAAARGP